jgi:hypothetical protein
MGLAEAAANGDNEPPAGTDAKAEHSISVSDLDAASDSVIDYWTVPP